MIYDRKTGETAEEKVYEDRAMDFLYHTIPGGAVVLLLRLPVVSGMYGFLQRNRRSIAKINNLIDTYGINRDDYESGYTCFNDFIIRKRLWTDFDAAPNHLIAPADSCVLAYTIHKGQIMSIKGKAYTLSRFLRDKGLADEYEGGTFLVFRLRVYDYHRFCFVDDGAVISRKRIGGFLDSVNRSATGRFTLATNRREISLLRTVNFGDIVYAEVGALLVGRIVQTYRGADFSKGDEKGYFEFGGSTLVLLLKKDIVKIDDDIAEYSGKEIETKVSSGERIGARLA